MLESCTEDYIVDKLKGFNNSTEPFDINCLSSLSYF